MQELLLAVVGGLLSTSRLPGLTQDLGDSTVGTAGGAHCKSVSAGSPVSSLQPRPEPGQQQQQQGVRVEAAAAAAAAEVAVSQAILPGLLDALLGRCLPACLRALADMDECNDGLRLEPLLLTPPTPQLQQGGQEGEGEGGDLSAWLDLLCSNWLAPANHTGHAGFAGHAGHASTPEDAGKAGPPQGEGGVSLQHIRHALDSLSMAASCATQARCARERGPQQPSVGADSAEVGPMPYAPHAECYPTPRLLHSLRAVCRVLRALQGAGCALHAAHAGWQPSNQGQLPPSSQGLQEVKQDQLPPSNQGMQPPTDHGQPLPSNQGLQPPSGQSLPEADQGHRAALAVLVSAAARCRGHVGALLQAREAMSHALATLHAA